MTYGYMGRLLFVNLTKHKISERKLTTEIARKYLGGSGLGARYLFDETGKDTEPFGEDNLLMFLTGPFTGTSVLSSGRHAVVTKSPHGIWGEADAGGSWGETLKKSGYDGVIIKGKADNPVYIWVNEGIAQIRDAGHLWGRDTYDTDSLIKNETSKNSVIASIGPAGEKLSRIAVILSDGKHARVCGRGGLGAVMGSKKLKAIAVCGTMKPKIADKENLNKVIKNLVPRIKTQMKRLGAYGTSGSVIPAHNMGDLPIKNWTMGKWEDKKIQNISGERMAGTILTKKYYCKKCIVGCGRVIKISEGPYSGVNGSGPEYETLGALGSLCLIDDLCAIAMGNELCNRYGIDTISTGSAIAFGMEAYEKGIITKADTDGIELKWGEPDVMIEMVHKIGKREGFGKLLGDGLKVAAQKIGDNAMDMDIEVKGLEPPMHDPRALASLAVSYATYPRGACHRGSTHNLERSCIPELGYDKPLERQSDEGKGVAAAVMQDYSGLFNSLKMCSILITAIKPSEFLDCLNYITGWDMDISELREAGERAFNLKRMYNIRLGMTRKEDTLPVRLTEKFETGGAAGYVPNLEKMLDEYYGYRGWSEEGIPLPSKLEALGLEKEADIVRDMFSHLTDC